MTGELLAYLLVPAALLAVWAYQRLADRARRWLHEDIRADQIIWWVQDHFRGSVAVQSDVETQPAADSSGSESAAGTYDRADSSRQTATARTDPATGVHGRSPVAGPNVPAPALPPTVAAGTDPAVGPTPPELDRGPQAAVDVTPPEVTSTVSQPRGCGEEKAGVAASGLAAPAAHIPGDPGGAGAVVPETTASARSAA